MYCIICGKKIKNGSQYCRFCGSPQEDYDPDNEDYTADENYAYDEDYAPDERYTSDDRYIPDERYASDGRYIPDEHYASDEKYISDERYASDDSFETDYDRKMRKSAPDRERYEEPVEHHFPFGILFVAILTVSVFIALVLFPNKLSLGLKSLKIPKPVEKVVDQFKEKTGLGDATDSAPAQDDDADSIVGVYKAVSAVYEGETLDGFMLKLANISFKVNEDGTFDARIKNEPYSGSWYQEGEYVEFVTDQFYFTGSFSEDILSMSDDSVGIAVVLEKK